MNTKNKIKKLIFKIFIIRFGNRYVEGVWRDPQEKLAICLIKKDSERI